MSRHLLFVLLSLSLLFSQQVAVVHELAHSFNAGQSDLSIDSQTFATISDASKNHQAVELCKTCLAFAQLPYSIPTQKFEFGISSNSLAQSIVTKVFSLDPRAFWVLNRGPPTFL